MKTERSARGNAHTTSDTRGTLQKFRPARSCDGRLFVGGELFSRGPPCRTDRCQSMPAAMPVADLGEVRARERRWSDSRGDPWCEYPGALGDSMAAGRWSRRSRRWGPDDPRAQYYRMERTRLLLSGAAQWRPAGSPSCVLDLAAPDPRPIGSQRGAGRRATCEKPSGSGGADSSQPSKSWRSAESWSRRGGDLVLAARSGSRGSAGGQRMSGVRGPSLCNSRTSRADRLGAVLVLVVVEGMAYRRGCRRLDVPIGTVRSRLARARTALSSRPKSESSALRRVK